MSDFTKALEAEIMRIRRKLDKDAVHGPGKPSAKDSRIEQGDQIF
jgi:hypothetical protein